MINKKLLYIFATSLMLVATLLMIFAKGILYYTMAGPDAPRIPHYYTYINPAVYFGGGMYFAPLAVIFSIASLLFMLVTICKSNSGRLSFIAAFACLFCIAIVVFGLPLTALNVLIAVLALLSTGITYFASYKFSNTP